MSLCVYIKHEKINIPLPEKLVLQSPGLQVPPSNLQRKEMDKRSKVDVMIPPRFFDSIFCFGYYGKDGSSKMGCCL